MTWAQYTLVDCTGTSLLQVGIFDSPLEELKIIVLVFNCITAFDRWWVGTTTLRVEGGDNLEGGGWGNLEGSERGQP